MTQNNSTSHININSKTQKHFPDTPEINHGELPCTGTRGQLNCRDKINGTKGNNAGYGSAD